MIIYGAFFIAVFVTILLLIVKRREFLYWEAALMLVIPLLMIIGAKAIIETTQTSATEYLGSYITGGRFTERWNEYIHRTCTQEHCSGTGKSRSCYTTTYDCSYVEDHPATWNLWDNVGNVFSITPAHWDYICNKFSSRTWVAMFRHYHTINGNAYDTKFNNDLNKLEPAVTSHAYENRVAVSDSIYKFRKVDPKTFGLFNYPSIQPPYYQDVILGDRTGLQNMIAQEWNFKYLNGLLGSSKQIKIFVVFFNNKPIQAGLEQQAFWSGGNKNEFIICIGHNGEDITWAFPFSWQDNKQLDVDTRTYLESMGKLTPENISQFAGWLEPQIKQNWHRKNFADFSYLSVEPPLWSVIMVYVLTIALVGGIAIWSISNEFENELTDIDFESYWERILSSIRNNAILFATWVRLCILERNRLTRRI